MEIKSDPPLRGTAWAKALEKLEPVFKTRTNYSLYLLSIAIGIMYDRRIEKPAEDGEEPRSVPRTVIYKHDNGKLDFMFQAAILSTTTYELTEDQRLELAFGESQELSRIDVLTQFANFGVTKLAELIGDTNYETMENIKNFLSMSVEGRNLEIDELPDDLLLSDV